MKKRLKNILICTFAVIGTIFVIMKKIADKQKPASYYENEPSEQNAMRGKKVVFVECEEDSINADGKQGHLEAVGQTDHKQTFYEKYVKRGLDIVLSFGGMVVLSPVYAVTALAIKCDDPGPVIFNQKRVGQDKRYFKLSKFRSMKLETPKNVPTHMLDDPDRYLLKVGKLIRKLSIDELPQLWNIFIGNMSVIGPRPALWNQDFLTAERDKYGANDIKPGLTGLAQAHGRDELEIPDKAKLDGEYAAAIKKSSLSGMKMDIKVFVDSVKAVIKSDGVVEGGTGEIHKQEEKVSV
nr:sugar transferase [Ruminococcus sp.]